ncbi:MAG: carbohydrate ABC transporter permease [Actinobacteria bacterium]|nr:carbohydrate ABC transporter permease [Actinomycetota bacterium]
MYRRNLKFSIFKYSILAVVLVFVLFPLYYMVATSFRSQSSMYMNPSFLPVDLQLKNYKSALASKDFIKSLINSLTVAGVATTVAVVFSVMAAYALTILRFKGRDTLGRVIVVAFLTPGALLFIPLAAITANIGMSNSLRGLILVYLSFTVPLGTYLLIGFFKNLVGELEEAARIDGATRLQALWYILLPLIAPGLVSVAILTFTAAWNELLYSLVINISPGVRTLPVAILNLSVADETPLTLIMAYSTIAAAPVMLLYFVGQKFIVEGLQTGAVKG